MECARGRTLLFGLITNPLLTTIQCSSQQVLSPTSTRTEHESEMFRCYAPVQRCAAINNTPLPGGPALGRTKDCRAYNSRLSTKAVAKMVSVGIVGAGFSGLCMAIKLQKAGLTNFTVFEAADDIGGTWRANRYPGCACDIQSVMYCYSFEPYPWTQHYSAQPEILEYLHHCAGRGGRGAAYSRSTFCFQPEYIYGQREGTALCGLLEQFTSMHSTVWRACQMAKGTQSYSDMYNRQMYK